MKAELLTQKLKKSDVHTEPYPYLIVKDVISEELCRKLLEEYPPLITTTGSVNFESNKRYSLPASKALKDESISPLWRDFIKENVSQKYLNQILHVFEDHIREAYPDFEKKFGKISSLRAGTRFQDDQKDTDVFIDTQICINTPVLRPTSVRGGHLDNPKKLVFGIFYMRHPDDRSMGGELEIYKHKSGDYRYDQAKDIDHKYLELLDKVPYQNNVLFLCLNTPDAVHGVSPRSSTDFPRFIVNIVTEMKEPLFPMKRESRWEAFLKHYGFASNFNARAPMNSPYQLGFYSKDKNSVLVLNPAHLSYGFPKIQNDYNIIQLGDMDKLSKHDLDAITAVVIGKGEEDLDDLLLEKLPNINVVGYATGSLKKYNYKSILKRNIPIINVGGVYAESVAEIALMHMIAGIRRASLSHNIIRDGGWGVSPTNSWDTFKGLTIKLSRKLGKIIGVGSFLEKLVMVFFGVVDSRYERIFRLKWARRLEVVTGSPNANKSDRNASPHTLAGSTVGIVGYGPVAREVIKLLRPFNVKIKVFSEYLTDKEAEALGVLKVALDEACKSDIVSIHRGLSERTKHSFGKDQIDIIPAGSVLVNTSRGKIVDEEALVNRLEKGDIIACLDVFEKEPLPKDSPLRRYPNVFTTSHIAASTDDTYRQAVVTLVEDVISYVKYGTANTNIIRSEDQIGNMT